MSDDREKRKSFWDDDEATSTGISRRPEEGGIQAPKGGPGTGKAKDSEQIDRKLQEARALMDQTHQLYLQYFNRVEKRPPIEKAKMLEAKVEELQRYSTNVTAAKFKVGQFASQYVTMKDLWTRKLKEMEGK
jgi:hypothetical protein